MHEDTGAARSPFPTPSQRRAASAEKRLALLDAAVAMFNERGFHATSLDDVAARVGVSKPVIYHHLGNKEQVLLECVAVGLDQLRAAAAEAKGEGEGALDRLRSFLVRYGVIVMNDFGRSIILAAEEALSPDARARFRSLKREVDGEFRVMLGDALSAGLIAVDDVRLAAFTLAGALNWSARWHRPDGEMSPETASSGIVDLLLAGLMPRGSIKEEALDH